MLIYHNADLESGPGVRSVGLQTEELLSSLCQDEIIKDFAIKSGDSASEAGMTYASPNQSGQHPLRALAASLP